MEKYDFSGWATRNDRKCSDGRTIRRDAFKDNDGQVVPLVWNHLHNEPANVLGHALLENRAEGVYAYCSFNDTDSGNQARELVIHGDIKSLSIFANQLKQVGGDVLHGMIREVSLVLAGANPEALIDEILVHGEISQEEAIIEVGSNNVELSLVHSKQEAADEKQENDETIEEVFNTLNEKQKNAVYAIVGTILEKADNSDEDSAEHSEICNETGGEILKHNLFDNSGTQNNTQTIHPSDFQAVMNDLKRYGSLRDSFIAHGYSEEDLKHDGATYGITNMDYLFPDDRNVTSAPLFISRDMGWVGDVMDSVHHTPFSRIKSVFADITADEARAKGYVKGHRKTEEVFSLLKRTTSPTTVYKKQKFDRDDLVDIVDFYTINFVKKEMRTMLDEELARAYLVGDGRSSASDDKINEGCIRPVWTDDDLYTVKYKMEVTDAMTDEQKARAFIKACIKSRKEYKGSGNPTLYTTDDMLTDCLLIENSIGERVYKTNEELATALRVKKIVTIPVMDNLTRIVDGKTRTLLGIIVNMTDYNVGADKGGAINTFEDFDIDYNQQKYLMETRCSGALIKPYSALVIESEPAAA